jgi:hypothetical protein
MSQFKLVSVHSLGQTALWHNLWGGYHHSAVNHCVEDYFARLFWHLMRSPRALAVAGQAGARALRPLWVGGGRVVGESFLLSCHMLCYQDWLLCLVTYYYACSDAQRAGGTVNAGLHNFLWAYHAMYGEVAMG